MLRILGKRGFLYELVCAHESPLGYHSLDWSLYDYQSCKREFAAYKDAQGSARFRSETEDSHFVLLHDLSNDDPVLN